RSWRSRNRWLTALRLTEITWRAFSPDASPYPVMLRMVSPPFLGESRQTFGLGLQSVQPALELVRRRLQVRPAARQGHRLAVHKVHGRERQRDDLPVP